MKSGGSASAASAVGGGNSLAIAERQKPAPSCVASLFQMLAKRKLFSSSSKKTKLLPPVRAQKFSPGRPPAGGEKTPAAKMMTLLLDAPYYPNEVTGRLPPGQDNSRSEMCTPGVVARLMGLSSMPATSHQKAVKAMDATELGGHRNECFYGGSIDNSHQKQQKPGPIRDVRHDNVNQFDADVQPVWSRKHAAHKVASPIKSPRSISSRNKARLIEAAVKVLEPGLQSRYRHQARRHAHLEYTCNHSSVQSAAEAMHNFSDQFSREMCDVDASRSAAQNVGATSLHNSTSNQWSEEDTKRNASVRRPNQNISCQVQSEGNHKGQRNGFKDNAQIASNAILVASQGVQKIQPKNMSRENADCRPLKQNNLKQNELPETYSAGDTGHMVHRQKHRAKEQNVANTANNFVCLNRGMNKSASLRSKVKVMDKIGMPHNSSENLSTKCHRTGGLHGDSSNKQKLKTATPKATEKDMIIAKGAVWVSEKPKSTSPNSVSDDSRRKLESCCASRGNKSGSISITCNSPRRAVPTLLNGHTKGSDSVLGSPTGSDYRRDCQNISSQRELVLREALQGISSLESAELVCFNRNELKNRDILDDRVTSLLFQNTSAIHVMEESPSDEFLWQCNLVDSLSFGFRGLPRSVKFRETHKMHEATTKASDPSHYADDGCISWSLLNTAAEARFGDRRRSEICTMQDAATKRNSRCAETNFGQHVAHLFEPAFQDNNNNLIHPGEVAATVELLLTNVRRSTTQWTSKAPFKAFLVQTFESALTTMTTTGSKKKNGFINAGVKAAEGRRSPLGNLVFDSVMECLDSMFTQFCDSGYRSFSRVPLICPEESLAAEVNREIARCSAMAGKGLDDLIASDVQHAAVEVGVSSLHEAFQIGVQIERDLLQELVAEIGLDMLKRL